LELDNGPVTIKHYGRTKKRVREKKKISEKVREKKKK